MTLENYLAIGLMGLLLAGLVFVVGGLIYDWYDTRKLRAQLKCRQEGYERGYLAGKADGHAEVQAEWDEAEKKRQTEEEKKRQTEEEKKQQGTWRYNNSYYIDEPLEILHVNGDVVNLVAEQTFPESDLEYVGADIAQRLLTNRVLDEAAQYIDVRTAEDPLTRNRLISVRLKVVRTTR